MCITVFPISFRTSLEISWHYDVTKNKKKNYPDVDKQRRGSWEYQEMRRYTMVFLYGVLHWSSVWLHVQEICSRVLKM